MPIQHTPLKRTSLGTGNMNVCNAPSYQRSLRTVLRIVGRRGALIRGELLHIQGVETQNFYCSVHVCI